MQVLKLVEEGAAEALQDILGQRLEFGERADLHASGGVHIRCVP